MMREIDTEMTDTGMRGMDEMTGMTGTETRDTEMTDETEETSIVMTGGEVRGPDPEAENMIVTEMREAEIERDQDETRMTRLI